MFDLELPSDFTPGNADGEVSDFYLLSIDEVKLFFFIFQWIDILFMKVMHFLNHLRFHYQGPMMTLSIKPLRLSTYIHSSIRAYST